MNNNLYGWVFTYNPYEKLWYAAKRENYFLLWNYGPKDKEFSENVFRSTDIQTLQYLIKKTNGDKKEINKLLKNNK